MSKYLIKGYKKVLSVNNTLKVLLSGFMLKDVKGNPLIVSFLINGLFFSLLLIFIIPVYRSNDDIILNLISAGFFGRENTECLLFGNIFLGKLLKLLYNIAPQYNCYLLFLIFTQFLSHVIILFYLLKENNRFFTLFIYLSIFLIFSINLFTEINFTGSSLIALSSSLLIINSILRKKGIPILDYVLSFLMLIISILIRKDAFYIYCFIFSLFPILYSNKWRKLLLIFFISVICFASIYYINDSYYKKKDPLQIEYRKANRFLLDGIEKPSVEELKKSGWTIDDYDFFTSFKGLDNVFFSKSAVINLKNEIPYKINFKEIFLSPYSLVIYLVKDIYYYALAFMLIMVYYFLMRRSSRLTIMILSFWILLFYLLGIILVHYRLYVYYSILFYLPIIGAYFVLQKPNMRKLSLAIRKKTNYVIFFTVILVTISLINIIHKNHLTNKITYNNYREKTIELMNSNKKFIIIGDESDYFLGKWSIFKSTNNNSEERLKEKIIPLGWFINTIQFDDLVNGSVIEYLVSGDIFLLGKDEEFFINFKKFILSHYHINADFKEIENFKYSKVYRLIKSEKVN